MRFEEQIDEALGQVIQQPTPTPRPQIPLEKCYQEDEGMYCYASPEAIKQNLGATITWVDKRNLLELINDPDTDNTARERLRTKRPEANGLYYIGDLGEQT